MEKTLLRPPATHTDSNLIKVKSAEDNTDLDKLTDEMKPYLEAASRQLLKPDEEVVNDLLSKISG